METPARRRPDLVRLRRWWYLLSFAALATAVGSMIAHGSRAAAEAVKEGRSISFVQRMGLNAGIDFTGGSLFRFHLAEPFPAAQEGTKQTEFRSHIQGAGLTRFKLQTVGTGDQREYLNIQTQALSDEELRRDQQRLTAALTKAYPDIQLEEAALIGPVVSQEILSKAVVAVVLGMILILGYVSIRYDFMFATCAIAALLHDALVMVGWASLVQVEVNTPFVAALLAVIGYSVNDTIVMFDRIRENLRLQKARTFAEVANISIWDTMTRSINTLLTVLFVLVALLWLGGVTLKPFVAAMTVGMISGGYSSIFFAAQLLTGWKQRHEARGARRAPGAQPRPAPAGTAPPPGPVSREPAPAGETTPAFEALATPPPPRARPSEEVTRARRERRKRRKTHKTGKRKRRH